MEYLSLCFEAIGGAVEAIATAFGFIYVVGFVCKTFLIFTDKAIPEDLNGWFNIWNKKEKHRL